ncbi:hypothetical protein PIB30_038032 [Stylosanthes scabra]|uniref:Uncharacterized protein n=1 Tax=Stylosanthes scabra TaxID=79078 RepID=A0ABU6TDK6_9FABA|nr:hypothetical protein [Stylosanthes scabra]
MYKAPDHRAVFIWEEPRFAYMVKLEVPPIPLEMDGMFPSAPVPAQPLQMAALVDDVPDPPLANGHTSSSSEEDPEEDPAWEGGQSSDSSDGSGAGVGPGALPNGH